MRAAKQVTLAAGPAAGPGGPGGPPAERGQAAAPPDEASSWLGDAAAPGRRLLRLAALAQVLETAVTAGQWAALAWVAQALLTRPHRLPWPAIAALAACGPLTAAAAWGTARLQAAGGQRISRMIRRRLVTGLLPPGQRPALRAGTSHAGHDREPDPATTALAAVELADEVASYHARTLPLRLSGPASMTGIFLLTAVVQWPAAVILAAGSLIVPLNMRLAGRFAREGADERMASTARLTAIVLESFRGMRTLRSIGALDRRGTELAAAAASLNAATMAVVRRAFLSGAVMEVVITFSIAVDATYVGLTLLGYLHLGAAPRLTLFSGLLALLVCPMYFAPLRAMAAAFHSREHAAAAVPVITSQLARPDRQAPGTAAGGSPPPSAGMPVAVTLQDVSFCFPGSARPVLRNVNMTVRPGQWTAVTGPSGAGKTTLLRLITGACTPASGTVQWVTRTGIDGDGVTRPWLGGCTWIGQQTVILPGSVGDNIRLGRPAASLAAVDYAMAAAGLADVVARLPRGLDTQLGEGGWGLSTGQARRISIARAFLRDAELWVLDEPTAHLDPDAEAQVISALRMAAGTRTVIVATHSAALARAADTVLTIRCTTVCPAPTVVPA